MRAHPFAIVLATWLVASHLPRFAHASPDALAAPQPALAGPSFHLDRRQESEEVDEHGEHDLAHDAHDHHHEEEPTPAPSHGGGHDHMHFAGSPMTELNETLILMYHKPTPPSYGTHDFEDPNVAKAYPGLMGLHIALMSTAFFVVLPMGIALRSAKHSLHGASVVAFYALCALGIASSMLYRKLTPNMYEGAVHAKQGYFVLFIAAALTTIDAFSTLRRIYRYVFAVRAGERDFSLGSLWRNLLGSQVEFDDSVNASGHEYTGLIVEDPEEIDMDPQDVKLSDLHQQTETRNDETRRWANNMRELHRQHRQRSSEWRASAASDRTLFQSGSLSPRSHYSDDTLQDLAASSPGKHFRDNVPRWRRVGRVAFATVERALVFLGYMQVLTGLVTYSGICRDSYVNVCLAHIIKGGIFWCYGLVTFARFLGSFADVGWSWNLAPRPDGNNSLVSAEFVECLVIFVYGITNTWMERFGVAPGSPFTSKEIQHIGIAVMFWFAGLVGMGIESRRIRDWMSAPVSAAYSAHSSLSTSPSPPSSYRASFNPFPALVIGVTGAAMSAHAQAYVFQMQIHVLWGNLLAAFAILRWLTYFFVWLGPPKSVMPGRPPTEALASFFLACGGLMFQMSTEEITIAAMRRGHADQMMFLNVAVAFTCFAFCWVLGVVAFKGWLMARAVRSTSSRTSSIAA